MFPRNVGADAIVFCKAWQADKTLDGGREVQYRDKSGKGQVWVGGRE